MATTPVRLASFPEELLEQILSLCVVSSTSPPPRPSWHPPQSQLVRPSRGRSQTLPSFPSIDTYAAVRTAPLLVCKSFLRIAKPWFYHTVVLRSAFQASLLLATLRRDPVIAHHVRHIVLVGVIREFGQVLQLCKGVRVLDLTLDAATSNDLGPDADEFCAALDQLRDVRHLVVRKPSNGYISQAKPRYVITRLAKALHNWEDLEIAQIAFRLSDDSIASLPASLSPAQLGPISSLTHALRTRPSLHTFATQLPSVWNNAILCVSQNEALERIVLGEGHEPASPHLGRGPYGIERNMVPGTGLFLTEARKHPRLGELIRAGTPIIRTRAHTMGTASIGLGLSGVGPTCTSSTITIDEDTAAGSCSSASRSGASGPCLPAGAATVPLVQRRWEL